MRITTKYTYIYRLVGVIGCLLVLVSLFVPWVTIDSGELQEYEEGDSPTGWQLANLEKGGEWDEKIFEYLFMIVYAFLILAPIGIIIILLGKDARGIGYYLTSLGVFFLILILFLMPVIQDSIPVPEDPYASMSEQEISGLDPSQKAQLDEQKAHRDRILNMKRIGIAPSIGVMLTVVGGIMTYVGSRMVAHDSNRIDKIYQYYLLLREAHKDGKITKEEEDLLMAQRKMSKITREEHEMLLRRMFPDEAGFREASYKHDNPVDMDRIIMEKNLQDYEVFLTQAYGHQGDPTKEELQMLEVIRRTLDIPMEDHYMVLDYLKVEGKIEVPGEKVKEKTKDKALTDLPKEVEPSKTEKEKARYIHSWQYKSTITREDPLTDEERGSTGGKGKEVPAGSRVGKKGASGRPEEKKDATKGRSGAKSGERNTGEAKASATGPSRSEGEVRVSRKKPVSDKAGAGKKRPSRVKCSKCGTKIDVPSGEGPVTIECPNCGVSGKI